MDIIHTVTVGDSSAPEDITDMVAAEVVTAEDTTVTAGEYFWFIHMVPSTIAVAVALVIISMVDIMVVEGGLVITVEVASAAMVRSIIGMVVTVRGIVRATILIWSSIATPPLKLLRLMEPSLKLVRLVEPTLKLVRLLERFHRMPLDSKPFLL